MRTRATTPFKNCQSSLWQDRLHTVFWGSFLRPHGPCAPAWLCSCRPCFSPRHSASAAMTHLEMLMETPFESFLVDTFTRSCGLAPLPYSTVESSKSKHSNSTTLTHCCSVQSVVCMTGCCSLTCKYSSDGSQCMANNLVQPGGTLAACGPSNWRNKVADFLK